MTFHLAFALLMLAWNARLLLANERLRRERRDPVEHGWRLLERQPLRDPRHPSSAPRVLPR